MNKLNIGDTIRCRDKDDMVDYMMALAKEGVETDFQYEMKGRRGYWLVVTGIEDGNLDNGRAGKV